MTPKRRLVCLSFVLGCTVGLLQPAAAQDPPANEEEPHEHAVTVVTEDLVLSEQIASVTDALEKLHRQITQRKKALQAAATDLQKASLYAELDGLRKEHDMLERLLHELVEEATATEWTKVDEALRRVRGLERYQEKQQRREDVLRDRRE